MVPWTIRLILYLPPNAKLRELQQDDPLHAGLCQKIPYKHMPPNSWRWEINMATQPFPSRGPHSGEKSVWLDNLSRSPDSCTALRAPHWEQGGGGGGLGGNKRKLSPAR